MMKRIQSVALVSIVVVALSLSPVPAVRSESTVIKPEDVRRIVDGTPTEFSKARFSKPARSDEDGLAHKLAPLIVEELGKCTVPGITAFPAPQADINAIVRATIYFSIGIVSAGTEKLDEVVFLWWHAPHTDCFHCGYTKPVFISRGVRVILGADGMPILWEALEDSSRARTFYVSQALEAAAREQFGAPIPGRNFSIERSFEENPNIIVARALDDGPVPMGPYVYIDGSCGRTITTLLCRCMSSQFDEVVEPVIEYQLEAIESLDEGRLREKGGIDLEKLLNPGSLDKIFRWPKM